MTLYHGSNSIVRIPDLSLSREDVDFGKGFYLSEDFEISAKWACRNTNSICNEYDFDCTTDLAVYKFNLDSEWLEFAIANRNLERNDIVNKYDQYDVLIGPIADDKLFATIDLYEDGIISEETAIQILNCMDYGNQYVLKSEKAVRNLKAISHIKIIGSDKEKYKRMYADDGKIAREKTENMIKAINAKKQEGSL